MRQSKTEEQSSAPVGDDDRAVTNAEQVQPENDEKQTKSASRKRPKRVSLNHDKLIQE